jgi:hypothetical protein
MACKHLTCPNKSTQLVIRVGGFEQIVQPWSCDAHHFIYIVTCKLPHPINNNPPDEPRYYTGSSVRKITGKFNSTHSRIKQGAEKVPRPNNLVKHFWAEHPGMNIRGNVEIAIVSECGLDVGPLRTQEAMTGIALFNAAKALGKKYLVLNERF